MNAHAQALVVCVTLVLATAAACGLTARPEGHVVSAGFWFEDVTFDGVEVETARLGGSVTQRLGFRASSSR